MARTRSNNPTEADHGIAIVEWTRFVRDRWPARVVDQEGEPIRDPDTGRPIDALDLIAHVPNGIWTHPRVAQSFVAQGMRKAFPDYVWPVPSADGLWSGLFLELKRAKPKSNPREDQDAFLRSLVAAHTREGAPAPRPTSSPMVVVAWGVWEACRVIQVFGGYPEDALKWIPDDRPPSRRKLDGVTLYGDDDGPVVVPW